MPATSSDLLRSILADEPLERQAEIHQAIIADRRRVYERAGEPDGCYYCGSSQHQTSDCREDS